MALSIKRKDCRTLGHISAAARQQWCLRSAFARHLLFATGALVCVCHWRSPLQITPVLAISSTAEARPSSSCLEGVLGCKSFWWCAGWICYWDTETIKLVSFEHTSAKSPELARCTLALLTCGHSHTEAGSSSATPDLSKQVQRGGHMQTGSSNHTATQNNVPFQFGTGWIHNNQDLLLISGSHKQKHWQWNSNATKTYKPFADLLQILQKLWQESSESQT